MIPEAKEIWEFCLSNQITLTAEHLLGTLNTRADKSSRETKNASIEWILNKLMFQKLIQALEPEDVELFLFRLCHQIPKYKRWKPDSQAQMVDSFQINWTHLSVYPFPNFAFIKRVLVKAMRDKCILIIITLVWPSQLHYTQLFTMSIQAPILWQTQTKSNTHCVRIKH